MLPLLSSSLCIVRFTDNLNAAQRPPDVFYDAPSPAAVELVMLKPHATSQACANYPSLSQRAGPADRSELHRRAAGPRPPIFTPNEDLKLRYNVQTKVSIICIYRIVGM